MSNPSEADVAIRVFEDGNGAQFRAEPGRAVTPRGQTVEWRNLTDARVRITLPDPEVLEGGAGQGIQVPPGGSSGPMSVSQDAERGAHPYMIVCRRDGGAHQCAEGGSHPVMIID